jgi:hypothetical protein
LKPSRESNFLTLFLQSNWEDKVGISGPEYGPEIGNLSPDMAAGSFFAHFKVLGPGQWVQFRRAAE